MENEKKDLEFQSTEERLIWKLIASSVAESSNATTVDVAITWADHITIAYRKRDEKLRKNISDFRQGRRAQI